MKSTPKKTSKKESAVSGSEQVAEFMSTVNHPLKKVMVVVRETILGTNNKITEHIKWNAPSFCVDGEDRITFNLHKNDCILLVFHRGAKVKDNKTKGPLFNDTTGLLEWVSSDRATVKFTSLEEVMSRKEDLKKVVKQLIKITS